MNGGLVMLKGILSQLSPSERKVGEYLLKEPEQAIRLTIAEIAEQSGGSQAAVVRLAKSLGLKGYPELKLKIAGDLASEKKADYEDFVPGKPIELLIHHVSDKNISSIADTSKVLSAEGVSRAAELLRSAGRVFFYGEGISNLIAQDAQNKFMRIFKSCFASPDAHLQLISAMSLQAEDVAVGISSSGETQSIVDCLKAARDNGASTISITRFGDNSLSRIADIPLYISSSENEIHGGAMASRIAQLHVVDILYLATASLDHDKSVASIEQVREAIRNRKRKG